MDRELFKVAVEVAHRIRLDSFFASGVSVFVKTKDFELHSRQCTMSQPSNVTAVILNEARRLIPTVWDYVVPLRQVGLSVFKLTHEAQQLSLFEDERMEEYRQWDRNYDERIERENPDHRHHRRGGQKALVFSYRTGEEALSAAKKAVRSRSGHHFSRNPQTDGTDCFEVMDSENQVIEKHTVLK